MIDLRIAIVCMHSVLGDIKGNLDRIAQWVGTAAREGAHMICFPESAATGYALKEPEKHCTVQDTARIMDRLIQMGRDMIICRGPGVMKRYWNRPEATAEALRDGWLYTGDLGRLDQDGELFIVGRKKDLIIKGGENIDPGVSENLLLKHPAILEAAVVGIPDAKYGEEVAAAVVLKAGKTVSESDLMGYMAKHLHHFVTPKKILFLDELPKTGVGKILKREIKKMFEN